MGPQGESITVAAPDTGVGSIGGGVAGIVGVSADGVIWATQAPTAAARRSGTAMAAVGPVRSIGADGDRRGRTPPPPEATGSRRSMPAHQALDRSMAGRSPPS
jgi:phytoene/squalene synthetase